MYHSHYSKRFDHSRRSTTATGGLHYITARRLACGGGQHRHRRRQQIAWYAHVPGVLPDRLEGVGGGCVIPTATAAAASEERRARARIRSLSGRQRPRPPLPRSSGGRSGGPGVRACKRARARARSRNNAAARPHGRTRPLLCAQLPEMMQLGRTLSFPLRRLRIFPGSNLLAASLALLLSLAGSSQQWVKLPSALPLVSFQVARRRVLHCR